MKNYFTVEDGYIVIYVHNKSHNKTLKVLIDDGEVFDRLFQFDGSIFSEWNSRVQSYYAVMKINKKSVRLHRFITNAPKGMYVDHKNHNTLDNRIDNLEITTNSRNMLNRKGAQKNNKSSGERCITWDKSKKRWQVVVRGKFIGRFIDIDDAINHRNQALEEVLK